MAEIPVPGSIISLISIAGLRYDGTLESLNMGPEEEPSLSLSNVKSFGTEDRAPPSGRFVPPAEDRFDFVIFKGTDITSLDVKQYYRGPPRQPFAPPPSAQDSQPATAYPQPQTSVWGPPAPSAPQSGAWGSQSAPASVPASQQPAPMQSAQASAPPAPGHQAAAPAPTVVVTPSMAPRPQVQPRQQAPRQPAWSNARPVASDTQQQPPPPTRPANQSAAPPSSGNAGPPPGFSGPPPGIQNHRNDVSAAPRSHPSSYANAAGGTAQPYANGGTGGRGQGRGRSRGRGRGHQGGQQGGNQAGQQGREHQRLNGPPRAPPVPVPNEDFNFEEALSRFDKDKLKQEADEGEGLEETPVVPQAYNKDDFFDGLSSDLADRLNTSEPPKRRAFSEQRKVDMETFGGSGVARRQQRGRGRGRGGPGRGGGRGRNVSQTVAVSS